jgi:DNA-binding HxlR family transcriptional regulator
LGYAHSKGREFAVGSDMGGAPVGNEGRSACPINLAVEILGDKWSLVVLRDIMFADRRYFRDLLQSSEEGIASNILAARLQALVDHGLVTRTDDPAHRQRVIYNLTESAIQLLPLMIQLGAWGTRHTPAAPEFGLRFQTLENKGPELWDQLMDELRRRHLDQATAR